MDTSSSKDGEGANNKQPRIRDPWSQGMKQNFPTQRGFSGSSTLPVFFDRTGQVALWWKDAYSFTAASSPDGFGQEAEEAELARAAHAALEIAQAASRELLNDLHNVTKSLGFWETKLHDSSSGLWWYLLLQTGPGHLFGEVYRGFQDVVSVASSTLGRSRSHQLSLYRKLPTASPHAIVDGKVRTLTAMQVSLATAVGEVHRHAGTVATTWGSSAEGFEVEHLRGMLNDSVHGLLITLQGVSLSKSAMPSGASFNPLPGTVPSSPLSKAVKTEFSRKPSNLNPGNTTKTQVETKSDSDKNQRPPDEIDVGASVRKGIDDIWQHVHLLECEGSRASSSAKAVIAANSKPLTWQHRWVPYAALATGFGTKHNQ